MLPSSPSGGSRLCESGDWVGMIFAQVEPLPYEANFMDLDPDVKDPLGLPVVRVTYSLQDNEVAAQNYILKKLEEIMTKMGATQTWPSYPPGLALPVNSHAYGGTRMGDDPTVSVVDKYGLAHEAPNLMVLGGSNFPASSGYNPTETIEAHAWYAADYLAKNLNKIAI